MPNVTARGASLRGAAAVASGSRDLELSSRFLSFFLFLGQVAALGARLDPTTSARRTVMLKSIRVKLNERVVIFKDGIPRRAYGPGRHWLWGRGLTEQRWDTDKLWFRALPEVRAVLPSEWYREVTLSRLERAVL